MKKILAILALAATSSAFAVTVTVDGQNSVPAAAGPDSNQITLSVKAPINPLLSVDGAVQAQSTETTNKLSSRLEAGLTAQKAIFGPVAGYARLGLGEKLSSSSEAFGYYSAEVGAIYATPVTGLTAKVGYRVRNAFSDNQADSSKTVRYSVSYALTKVDTIGVRYDDVRGDGAAKASAFFYTRGF